MSATKTSSAPRAPIYETPAATLQVDLKALAKARKGTPAKKLHVDLKALAKARKGTPAKKLHG